MTDSDVATVLGSSENSSVKERIAAENGLELLKYTADKAQKVVEEQEHHKKKLQEKIQVLKNEVTTSEDIARQSKNKLKHIQETIVSIKDQLIAENQNKTKAAEKLVSQFNSIKRIYIEDPIDISNELFKWYLGVVYNESPAKYDFKNFIDETINRDKGADFANRLKGLRVFELGKEETAATALVLSKEEDILKEMQEFNPSYMGAVTDAFNYIRVISEVIRLSQELKKHEATYTSTSYKSDIDSANYLKAFTRYESAKNDLALSEKAIKTFSKVLDLAQSTQSLCKNKLGQN